MTVLLIILGILITAGILFTVLFYRYVFCRHQPKLLRLFMDGRGHGQDYYDKRDRERDKLILAQHNEFSICSERGERLTGYYYCAGDKPCGRIAFIVHGYRSNAMETAGMFREYYKSRGFDLFCCDNTAHGKSEGELIGYDVFESADCQKWLSYLESRFGKDIQVILHGFSMGGATVASMSDRVPDCVKFIVDDCGYTSVSDILKPRLGVMYGVMRMINRLVAGYELSDTDARGHISHAKVPVLFAHGREDRTVPFVMGEELYSLCSSDKDALFVDCARHMECIYRKPEEYAEKLDAFIERYIK